MVGGGKCLSIEFRRALERSAERAAPAFPGPPAWLGFLLAARPRGDRADEAAGVPGFHAGLCIEACGVCLCVCVAASVCLTTKGSNIEP